MGPTDASPCVTLGIADIDDALLLSDEARWNQIAEDWAVFMSPGECYGVRIGGRLVASAAILPFVGGFGWISMVLVTADSRRRGLASGLMDRCIEAMRRRGAASLLDATPEGAQVYSQLGFRTRCRMARWRGIGTEVGPGEPVVQPRYGPVTQSGMFLDPPHGLEARRPAQPEQRPERDQKTEARGAENGQAGGIGKAWQQSGKHQGGERAGDQQGPQQGSPGELETDDATRQRDSEIKMLRSPSDHAGDDASTEGPNCARAASSQLRQLQPRGLSCQEAVPTIRCSPSRA